MKNNNTTTKVATRAGALIGFAAFLLVGLKPAFVYGGFIGVITASTILGGPVGATLAAQILVAGGMMLGVLAVGFFLTVVGSIAGAVVDLAVLAPLAEHAEHAEEQKLEPAKALARHA